MARQPKVQKSLFATAPKGPAPLAERVRPRRLEEVIGHRELLKSGGPLWRAVDAARLPSILLWGPPGCGKTTLARAIAEHVTAAFVPFSAVLGGVARVREIVAEADERRGETGEATILFVDEIHRFNKSQQDAFLPHVEDGTVSLIGATTENPSFSLNAPLLSRCVTYRLEPLSEEETDEVLSRALAHPEGYAGRKEMDAEARGVIATAARGDARRALGLLEVAVNQAGMAAITADVVREVIGHEPLLYDKSGDEHYNVVSAFIKSMRGSDPDAAVYWMMRMIEAGEDPLFVMRRIIIFASEDVGNADPRALQLAVSADQAFQRLGLPEGLYPMAQVVTYLACAPKSNAANVAWHEAQAAVREHGALPVPMHLRNAPTKLMKNMGYGQGYRYAHNEADGFARGERYLPERLVGRRFYRPTDRGLEAKIGAWLRRLRGEDE